MSIAQGLTDLAQAKSDIKAAIEAKGVSTTGVPFTEYDSKIAEISGGGGLTPEGTVGSYTVVGDPIAAGDFVTIDGSNVSKRAEVYNYKNSTLSLITDAVAPGYTTGQRYPVVYDESLDMFFQFYFNTTNNALYVYAYTVNEDRTITTAYHQTISTLPILDISTNYHLAYSPVTHKVTLQARKTTSSYNLYMKEISLGAEACIGGSWFAPGGSSTTSTTIQDNPIGYTSDGNLYLRSRYVDNTVSTDNLYYYAHTAGSSTQVFYESINPNYNNGYNPIYWVSTGNFVGYIYYESYYKQIILRLYDISTNAFVTYGGASFTIPDINIGQVMGNFKSIGNNKYIIYSEYDGSPALRRAFLITVDTTTYNSSSIVEINIKTDSYAMSLIDSNRYISFSYIGLKMWLNSFQLDNNAIGYNYLGDQKVIEIPQGVYATQWKSTMVGNKLVMTNRNSVGVILVVDIYKDVNKISGIAASAGESGQSINVYSPEVI